MATSKKEKNHRVILSLPESAYAKLVVRSKSLGLGLSQFIRMKMMEDVSMLAVYKKGKI